MLKRLFVAALILRAGAALAVSGGGGPVAEISIAPVPGGEAIVALCAGEDPCDPDFLIAMDPVEDCWVCFDPTALPGSLTECTGTGQEAIGPLFIGEGAAVPCDGCAGAGVGDLVVRGGNVYFSAALSQLACTADGSDTFEFHLSAGGAAATTRGGLLSLFGNEFVPAGAFSPGDAWLQTGDIADATLFLRSNASSLGGIVQIIELGATDMSFVATPSGWIFQGSGASQDVALGPLTDFILEDASGDDLKISSPAAITAYTLMLPPDDGDVSECLVTNGSAVTTWEPCVATGVGATETLLAPPGNEAAGVAMTYSPTPAVYTEISNFVTRTKMKTNGYTTAAVIAVVGGGGPNGDVRIQCDTDQSFGSPTTMASFPSVTTGVNFGTDTAIAGECANADVFLRAGMVNGNGADTTVIISLRLRLSP